VFKRILNIVFEFLKVGKQLGLFAIGQAPRPSVKGRNVRDLLRK